ncbi:MAG: YebC/PmpR family DNA-binding transcriptional regulator [Rickettsiales bacterium]
MAGHSQFKNIMYRKGAQDAKRAKLFTKLLREIYVAAKDGADVNYNSRLRTAMATARQANIPKDRIETAVEKASNPADSNNFEEMRYEGYAPGGIAVIVEALTDSRNRAASDIRSLFTKSGGQLGETGSVSFLFKHLGLIYYPKTAGSEDDFIETLIEAGGSDCIPQDEYFELSCEPDDFARVRDALEAKFGSAESAQLTWRPLNSTVLSAEDTQKVERLIDALEDLDDVQNVICNAEL